MCEGGGWSRNQMLQLWSGAKSYVKFLRFLILYFFIWPSHKINISDRYIVLLVKYFFYFKDAFLGKLFVPFSGMRSINVFCIYVYVIPICQ